MEWTENYVHYDVAVMDLEKRTGDSRTWLQHIMTIPTNPRTVMALLQFYLHTRPSIK